jgi:hypothetical protein
VDYLTQNLFPPDAVLEKYNKGKIIQTENVGALMHRWANPFFQFPLSPFLFLVQVFCHDCVFLCAVHVFAVSQALCRPWLLVRLESMVQLVLVNMSNVMLPWNIVE